MAYDSENIFAKILEGAIPCNKIYEDDHALAFHDINPQAEIHALVIPKGSYISMADFTENAPDDLIVGFMRAIHRTADILGLKNDGFRSIANAGANAHQEVPHLHIHLMGGQILGPMLDRSFIKGQQEKA